MSGPINWQYQAGPCVVCGATNYPLSVGGPGICPPCDCGPPSPRRVRAMKEEIEQLKVNLALSDEALAACQAQAAGRIRALTASLDDANQKIDAEWLRKALEESPFTREDVDALYWAADCCYHAQHEACGPHDDIDQAKVNRLGSIARTILALLSLDSDTPPNSVKDGA